MKTTSLLFAIILLCGCHNHKKKIEIPENDWDQAVTAFRELQTTLKKEKGETWNYSLQGPVFLVNRKTRTIIANERDDSGKLIRKKNLYVGSLPENIIIAHTAVEWNGKRWTMVALPLPEKKEERLNHLIHESFHRIQPAIGFDSLSEIQCIHLDTEEGRIYLQLELEALKRALSSQDPERHIKNALRFRHYRYQIFPEAKKAENSLEINEGLAEYTGSLLSQRTDTDLKEHYIANIDWFFTMPTFVRSFPYFTIPVYGYFMHKTEKHWNLKITQKNNLTDFISGFWSVKDQELTKEDMLNLGEEYGIDTITEKEIRREAEKEALRNQYRKTFLGDSIVELGLENMEIGFDPSNIMPLDSLGTVYPNLRITDNWGILEVDSGGALVSPGWDKVTLSYPGSVTDSLIAGKGWKLKLYKSWKLEWLGSRYTVSKK